MTEANMDFTLDDEQAAVRALAESIFGRFGSDDRVRRSESDGNSYDAELWRQIIASGLLDAVLQCTAGGQGLGMVGLALIAEQQGRHLARVPLVSTATAAMALGALDPEPPLLASIRDGSARVCIAASDHVHRVTARRSAEKWILDGEVSQVHMAGACTHILVIADVAGEERVFVVPMDTHGVDIDRFQGMSRNVHGAIRFTAVRVDGLPVLTGSEGIAASARRVRELHRTGLAAIQAGVCREAVRRTAEYTSTREQFGRPLSTNQGVAMRAADAHIDTEIIRLTMLDAAWNLDHGSDARCAVLAAAWWACEGGFRVVHATQHLHGGMGADIDNHIHRFFLWAREIDIVAGPAPALLAELGESLRVSGAGRSNPETKCNTEKVAEISL